MSDQPNTDTNFSLYHTYSYTLLLQVEATTFSYAVAQDSRLLVSAQNVAISELITPNQLSDILTATYKSVIISLPANALTLVPNKLFNEDHIGNFARFLDVKTTEKVFAQTLDAENTIIYKTDDKTVSIVEKFNLQNTCYRAKGWIKAIAKSSPPDNFLYMEVNGNRVEFAYFLAGALRFYNTFSFYGEDELVYFTTFVGDELNLQPLNTTLIVSGDINTADKNYTRLLEFYPKMELSTLRPLSLPGQLASHKLLALAALSLCGSSEGV